MHIQINRTTSLLAKLKERDFSAVFHYIPLHTSPAGLRFARSNGELAVTNDISNRLLRLPLWLGLEEHQQIVIEAVNDQLSQKYP